jgi:hypothetical protein
MENENVTEKGKGGVHIRLAVLLVFEKGRNTEFD